MALAKVKSTEAWTTLIGVMHITFRNLIYKATEANYKIT